MSKYYKAEDVIRKRAEDLADTSYWEWGNPKNVDDWIEVAEMEFADLPTIEVMEYPQVDGITPTLVNTEVNEDFVKDTDVPISEDCISREYLKSFEYINKGDFNSVETIREWIDNAPSVVPKVNKDEWVEEFSDDGWRWIKDEL